ncbi:hypothetical protein H4R20_005708 [Coemansia guatemalensis]|uniref:AMP-activated protein kinase glycogen-binding domain-containing protein n=1 Tax=Coemansia guatemalensis TaxID=2761395 RepID=A0A9W8LQI8_9FUNG|nr:hypothetical protein H4R20_005708 [Coemansia guatemalensis]
MDLEDNRLIDTTVEWSGEPAKSVAIRGTFSKDSSRWWQDTIELTPNEDCSRFSVTLLLCPGRYEFKFVINGSEWRVNPALYPTAEDGRGNVNNVIDVVYHPQKQQPGTTLTIDYARTRGGGSEVTLGRSGTSPTASMVSDHGATSTQTVDDAANERTKLLGACLNGSGKLPEYASTANPTHSNNHLPTSTAALQQGSDEVAGASGGSRLRRYAIGALVVLLFMLLGAVSAVFDS